MYDKIFDITVVYLMMFAATVLNYTFHLVKCNLSGTACSVF